MTFIRESGIDPWLRGRPRIRWLLAVVEDPINVKRQLEANIPRPVPLTEDVQFLVVSERIDLKPTKKYASVVTIFPLNKLPICV